jgi:undecaprenyl-diphosphatase
VALPRPEITVSLLSFCAGVPALVLLAREAAWVARRRLLPDRLPPGRLLGLAMAAVLLIVLCGVTATVLAGAASGLDNAVNRSFDAVRVPALVVFFLFVTDMGSGGATLAVGLVASLLLWLSGRSGAILPLWFAGLATKATVWGTKFLFALPRPVFVTEATATSPTFPSDHAAMSLVVYGFVACVAIAAARQARARFEIAWWAAVLILAVGFSRIFLGVHHVSDVLAGYLLGGFWLLAALALPRPGVPRA